MTADMHWWLVGLAFVLGMVLTFTMMVYPAKYQVPVGASTRGGGAKSRPPAKKTAAGDVRRTRPRVPKVTSTAKAPVGEELPTQQIPVAEGSLMEPIKVAEELLIPSAQFAPYGPGSVRADADGGGPPGWLVKGRSDTRLYYTADDPEYDPTVAQVWFEDEDAAARAFFTPWRKSRQRK